MSARTLARIDAYLRLAEAATPDYPLASDKQFGTGFIPCIKGILTTKRTSFGLSIGFKRIEDANFIAASRTDGPWAANKLREAISHLNCYRTGLAALLEANDSIECRGDEDCDHCFMVQTDADASKFLKELENAQD